MNESYLTMARRLIVAGSDEAARMLRAIAQAYRFRRSNDGVWFPVELEADVAEREGNARGLALEVQVVGDPLVEAIEIVDLARGFALGDPAPRDAIGGDFAGLVALRAYSFLQRYSSGRRHNAPPPTSAPPPLALLALAARRLVQRVDVEGSTTDVDAECETIRQCLDELGIDPDGGAVETTDECDELPTEPGRA